jgi:hypothetical protein
VKPQIGNVFDASAFSSDASSRTQTALYVPLSVECGIPIVTASVVGAMWTYSTQSAACCC